MITINLLPWRAYRRATTAKLKKYGLIAVVMVCGLIVFCRMKVFADNSLPPPRPFSPPASQTLPQKGPSPFQLVFIDGQRFVTLDLQNMPLDAALHQLASRLHLNVVISPEMGGVISLHLQKVLTTEVFDSVVAAAHLKKWREGAMWFVGTSSHFIQYQQDELKLKTAQEEVAPLITRVYPIHYAKAEDIAHVLQDNQHSLLSKRGQVRVDARTNVLCVQDMFSQMAAIDRLIRRLDVQVPQVLIKVRLASLDHDYQRALGIEFLTATNGAPTISATSAAGHYGLALATLTDATQLDIQLSALETAGHGELISSPSLFTASQQTASIEAGEEIPYQEISKSGATGVAFKKAVLSLKVTPQVMPGQQILLQLQVNQDKPNNRMVLGVPAITTRQMSTQVLVKNGQTIVLGGIFETNKEHEEHRVPFLGKIPGVGWLFRQDVMANNKRELLIFVTPKISDAPSR